VLGNAVLDAGISAWSAKFQVDPTNPANTWDFWRPITAIRERYKGKMINSWKGPYLGYGLVPAEQWRPYQAPNVVTPPFPEYTSGHSTFSGAARIAIIAFTGSDSFNSKVTIPAGTSLFEPKDATHPVGTPAKDVVLSWKTLMDASDQAGMSRRYGGIHFYSGDMNGRAVGRQVAQYVYSKAQSYIKGNTGK
jgi:vanadium-dependent haloperoxidase-like protein